MKLATAAGPKQQFHDPLKEAEIAGGARVVLRENLRGKV
jgi:hypothetical protein